MSFRRLSRNAIASIAQVVGSAMLLLELYRFLVRQLGPGQIGVWSLVVACTAPARLGEMGIGTAVTKFVAGDLGASKPRRAAATIGMCSATVAAIIGAFSLLVWSVAPAVLTRLVSDDRLLSVAQALVPWALASLWFASIGQVRLGALDALQRSDLKAVTTVSANSLQLAAAYVLVPKHGLLALGEIQLVNAGLAAVGAMALVVGVLAVDTHAWFDWNRRRLVDAIRYGAGMQLSTLGQLLFDPVVKALLARVGPLSVVGYYEIAIRFVTQCRSVIAAAYQALIPYLAHRAGDRELAKQDIVRAYRLAHSLLVVIALPFFSVVAVGLPLVFDIWLGRNDATFIAIGLACLVGFCVNTLSVSAYVIYLAIGRIRWTIWTQFGIGVLNVALASIGARVFGVGGVVAGGMIAPALGGTKATSSCLAAISVPRRAVVPRGRLGT